MDYFTTHFHGPSGLIVSLLLVTIRQPVVARTQVNVMPYASGTYPIFVLFNFFFFILSPQTNFSIIIIIISLYTVSQITSGWNTFWGWTSFWIFSLDDILTCIWERLWWRVKFTKWNCLFTLFDLFMFCFSFLGRAGPFETCVNVTSGEEGRCMFAMVISFPPFIPPALWCCSFTTWHINLSQHVIE